MTAKGGATATSVSPVGIAAPLADVYSPSMCRNITRDQRIEGWRAFVELLPKLRPRVVGVMAAVLVAHLYRGISKRTRSVIASG